MRARVHACVHTCVCVKREGEGRRGREPRYFVRDVHLSHRARRPFVSASFPFGPPRAFYRPSTRSTYPARAHARTCVLSTRKSCVYHSTAASSQPFPPPLVFAYLLARPFVRLTILPYYLQHNVHACVRTCRARVQSVTKKERGIKGARSDPLSRADTTTTTKRFARLREYSRTIAQDFQLSAA